MHAAWLAVLEVTVLFEALFLEQSVQAPKGSVNMKSAVVAAVPVFVSSRVSTSAGYADSARLVGFSVE
jgi:hypothetical protein